MSKNCNEIKHVCAYARVLARGRLENYTIIYPNEFLQVIDNFVQSGRVCCALSNKTTL